MKHTTAIVITALLSGAWAAPVSNAPKPPPVDSPLPPPPVPAQVPSATPKGALPVSGVPLLGGLLDSLLGGGKGKRQLIASDLLHDLEGIDLGHTAKRDLPAVSPEAGGLGALDGVLGEGKGVLPVPGGKNKRQLIVSDLLADLESVDLGHTAKRDLPVPSGPAASGILNGLLNSLLGGGKGKLPVPPKAPGGVTGAVPPGTAPIPAVPHKRDLPVPSDALAALTGVLPTGGKAPVLAGEAKRQLPTGAQGGEAGGADALAGALGNLIPGLGSEAAAATPQQ